MRGYFLKSHSIFTGIGNSNLIPPLQEEIKVTYAFNRTIFLRYHFILKLRLLAYHPLGDVQLRVFCCFFSKCEISNKSI